MGAETFRQELLDQAHSRAGENHHAAIRRETAEEKARRILGEELDNLGWPEIGVGAASRERCAESPDRPAIAGAETSVTLKWIAQRLQMGTWTHVANLLHGETSKTNDQTEMNLCQK